MKQTWHLALGLTVAALCAPVVAGQAPSAEVMLEAARRAETIDGNPKAAIAQYEQIVKRFASDRAVVADALVRMAGAYRKLGDKQATAIYQRVLKEFGDQAGAAAAARAALGPPTSASERRTSLAKRLLWSGPDVDPTGRISPDGRWLTFTDWETGDLAVRDLEAGTNRRLTSKGSWTQSSEYAELSVLSPDGQWVAYGWYDGKFDYDVRVMSLQGGAAPRRLFSAGPGTWVAPMDWSSDGERLIVWAGLQGGRSQLIVIDARTGSVVQVVDVNDPVAPRFSPDGRMFAYGQARTTPNGLARDIVVLDIAAKQEHRVFEGSGYTAPMAWTENGLLYASTRGASTVLWLQRMRNGVADGKPALVTNDAGGESLGVTRTGALVFAAGERGQDLYLADVDLHTGELKSEPTRPLDDFMGSAMQPTWSRDGSALAYVSPRSRSGRNAVLGIRDTASGRVRELRPALTRFFMPRWTPDGRAVIVNGLSNDSKQGLFSIDVVTGAVSPVVLARDAEQLASPQPSPDGKQLYFVRVGKGGGEVIARDMATGSERRVTEVRGPFLVQLSPDGRTLAMVVRDAAANRAWVGVVPSSGGELRAVYGEQMAASLTNWVSWSNDSAHLFVMKATDGSTPARETLLVPVNGGTHRPIRVPGHIRGPLALHPSDTQLAYTAGETRHEVWVLENFLPPAAKAARK